MVADVDTALKPGVGWRERKRKQTRERIAKAGLKLFVEQGFEATTLDAIADAAAISRRTFFHYFDSKEGLLAAYEDQAEQSFRVALSQMRSNIAPFEVMSAAMLEMVSSFATEEAKAIDRLMRSTESLRARKQANYERLERFVSEALAEKWPDPADHLRLRIIAMVGVGIMRLAADRWSADGCMHSVQSYMRDGLSLFKRELSL